MIRASVQHPLGTRFLPNNVPVEEIDILYQEFLTGNKEAERKIIISHIRLGMSIVAQFAVRSKYHVDDLVGEMSLALVDSVNKLKTLKDPNVTGYIASAIRYALIKYTKKQTRIRKYENGSLDNIAVNGRLEWINYDILVKTRIEQDVLELRLQGMTDEEIGKKLGRTKQAIHQIRCKIKERFLRKYK